MRTRQPRNPSLTLLSQRWRTGVHLGVPLGILGLFGLGWRYAGTDRSGQLDTVIDNQLMHSGQHHHQLLWPLADLGSPPGMVLGIVIVLWLAHRTGRRWPAMVLATAGPVLASVITETLLKPLLDRTHHGGLSLPSGHATAITAQATVCLLIFVAAGTPRRLWVRSTMTGLGALLIVAVSAAMVALDRHYATDTVAGMLVGSVVVGTTALVLDRCTRRLRPSLPPVP